MRNLSQNSEDIAVTGIPSYHPDWTPKEKVVATTEQPVSTAADTAKAATSNAATANAATARALTPDAAQKQVKWTDN